VAMPLAEGLTLLAVSHFGRALGFRSRPCDLGPSSWGRWGGEEQWGGLGLSRCMYCRRGLGQPSAVVRGANPTDKPGLRAGPPRSVESSVGDRPRRSHRSHTRSMFDVGWRHLDNRTATVPFKQRTGRRGKESTGDAPTAGPSTSNATGGVSTVPDDTATTAARCVPHPSHPEGRSPTEPLARTGNNCSKRILDSALSQLGTQCRYDWDLCSNDRSLTLRARVWSGPRAMRISAGLGRPCSPARFARRSSPRRNGFRQVCARCPSVVRWPASRSACP
jgi:hypothetical protein